MKVKGSIVFVTGASRGLGLAFVHEAGTHSELYGS
jgi:NAD(P)-dependent dehydrogenase (short-subunit alcohol dehydrogenase family)